MADVVDTAKSRLDAAMSHRLLLAMGLHARDGFAPPALPQAPMERNFPKIYRVSST